MDPGLYRSVINGWLDGVVKHNLTESIQFEQLLNDEIQAAFEAFGLLRPNRGRSDCMPKDAQDATSASLAISDESGTPRRHEPAAATQSDV